MEEKKTLTVVFYGPLHIRAVGSNRAGSGGGKDGSMAGGEMGGE